MDDEDAQALRAEGLDPDDPAVVAAVDVIGGSYGHGVATEPVTDTATPPGLF